MHFCLCKRSIKRRIKGNSFIYLWRAIIMLTTERRKGLFLLPKMVETGKHAHRQMESSITQQEIGSKGGLGKSYHTHFFYLHIFISDSYLTVTINPDEERKLIMPK